MAEYLVPVSSMVAASGYAFQLELFLNDDAKLVGSTNTNAASYSLEEVSFDVELVEVSDAIMADINSELANGAQIPLPYKSWRSHQTAISGAGTEHKIDISESAMNLTNMYSVLVPQSCSQMQSVTSAKYLAKEYDPYSFYGGRKALNASGAFTDATDYVNKYIWKYGSSYYPQAPNELVPALHLQATRGTAKAFVPLTFHLMMSFIKYSTPASWFFDMRSVTNFSAQRKIPVRPPKL